MRPNISPRELRRALRVLARDKTFSQCRRRFDSSDIAQEAFIQIWKQLLSGATGDFNFQWLKKVVRGNATNMNRFHTAQKRSTHREESSLEPNSRKELTPEQVAILKEEINQVARAFEGLPMELQDPARMYFYLEMNYTEIGKATGESAYMAKRKVEMAVEHMHRKLFHC